MAFERDSSEGVVLVVVGERDEAARVALGRAWALAAAGGTRLWVVEIVPRGATLADVDADLDDWCAQLLPAALREAGREVREGDFVTEATAIAGTLSPTLIVVPADPSAGQHARELVRCAHVPVFVARAERRGGVVGAVDLERPELTVLRQVAAFTVSIHGSPVLVHPLPEEALGQLGQVRRRVNALRAATQWLLPGADVVVTARASPVQAILEVARGIDSDVIVVGEAPGGADGHGIAGELIALARRSVLVTPVARRAVAAA